MAYQLDQISVLIVEDNQPMASMVKGILQTFGIKQIYVAKNGEIGFGAFCRYNPDFVIADWMMKPVDGIELTKLIRNESRSPNPFAPIILMTGFSEKRRVMEARDAGVTEFLVKPFQARDLYRRIAQLIERPRQFVSAGSFFGPDRRRKVDERYEGALRRNADFSIDTK